MQHHENDKIGPLLKQSYEILYGKDLSPKERQVLLQRYGCAGWTEDVILTALGLGANRGFVEVGAGNGQWARVLTDRFKQIIENREPLLSTLLFSDRSNPFDSLLASQSLLRFSHLQHKSPRPPIR
jgi:hypothetical protein